MKKPRHFNEEAAEPCDLFDNTDLVIEKLCQHYGLDPEEAEEIIKPAAPKNPMVGLGSILSSLVNSGIIIIILENLS